MGIFSSGLNLMGTAITNNSNERNVARTNRYNYIMHEEALEHEKQLAREAQAFSKAENELAFEREKEMWNMQNEYNSPESQMQRYQDAGLNPLLIYGQGTPGNATSAPSYNATQGVKANVPTPPYSKPHKNQAPHFDFNLLQDYQVLSGIKEMKENGALQRDLMREEIDEKRISNKYLDAKENLDLELQGVQIAKERGLIDESTARYEYQRIQNKIANLSYKFDVASYETRLNKLVSDYNLSVQQEQILKRNFELLGKDLKIKDSILQEYKDKHELHSATDYIKFKETLNNELDARSKQALLDIANIESENKVNDIMGMNNKQLDFAFKIIKMFTNQ